MTPDGRGEAVTLDDETIAKLTASLYDETKRANEIMQQCYPGFFVICAKCFSRNVSVENSLAYSETSGAWGSVDLVCQNCGQQTTLVDTD